MSAVCIYLIIDWLQYVPFPTPPVRVEHFSCFLLHWWVRVIVHLLYLRHDPLPQVAGRAVSKGMQGLVTHYACT